MLILCHISVSSHPSQLKVKRYYRKASLLFAVWHWSISPLISTGPLASLTCCWGVWQTLHSPPGIPLASYHYTLLSTPPISPSFFFLTPSSSVFFSPFSLPLSPPPQNVSFKSTKKCLIVMQATETPMQSDVPAIHLKLHVRSFGLTLALRALTQREMRMDERVEVRCSARGHFKRTHGLCWSLWVSWRSNQRLFSFKKGYFTDRLACSEVVNYHAREGNPGSYSNHCTWEALIDRTDPDTQRALGSVHIAREIT